MKNDMIMYGQLGKLEKKSECVPKHPRTHLQGVQKITKKKTSAVIVSSLCTDSN